MSPLSGTVWEGLGSVSLLEEALKEVFPYKWALRFQRLHDSQLALSAYCLWMKTRTLRYPFGPPSWTLTL